MLVSSYIYVSFYFLFFLKKSIKSGMKSLVNSFLIIEGKRISKANEYKLQD